ncbi:diguanylate cyclase domain-containing protein [Brevundimonas sp. Leaf363]|uniref:diguanylate cyclase domain-containing protein n=1 Tax=Brevundimonas sp. Leaf363 TaxID=1736353 RepID=UPI000AABEA8A|nr:diguanylate cyclase [Brevundimonas sp. Leaf363]
MAVQPGILARVLVVAADDAAAGPLCQGLDALGWRTVTARSVAAAAATLSDLPLEAAVIFAAPGVHADVASIKAAAQPRTLPLILVTEKPDPEDAEAADLVMSRTPHPAQAALRLEQLGRAAISEEEFSLRRATFAAHGLAMSLNDAADAPLRVLAAGKPDHHFLALSNCLAAVGAEVIAAPTPYTAFDYLHESAFDAALLWGGEDHAPALSIASGMKRNTRLFHIPLVLYLRGAGEINLSELYNRGFADVAAADTPEEETANRILALARTHRRHQTLRRALDGARSSSIMDETTGLFTRELFASHLARVAEGARARKRPLSACVLRVAQTGPIALARTGGWLDRAMPQIGAMVGRLVRVEDTAARLAPEVFALALPATTGPAARLAAERIAAVIGCTAFDAGPDRAPFVVEFDVGVAELGDGEAPGGLLERASADIRSQPRS